MEQFMTKMKKGIVFTLSRIVAFFLVAMTCLVLYQVFTRYLLNNPSDFTEELVRYLLIWTGFIGSAYAFNTRGHMALVFFKQKLPEKQEKMVTVLIDLLILLFALFVMVMGGAKLSYSTMGALSALLGVPRGLVYIMAPISGVFIILGQIINIWEDITGKTITIEEGV